jgi:flagellar biosynthesis component FlhA
MAWLYERKGSLEDALQWYELSLPKRPNWEGIIRGKIGEIKLKQGKYEEAREEIALAYQVDKNEDVYRRTMATIFNAEGNECYSQTDYGKAIEKYERAIEFNPKDEIFHSNLAGAWEKLSDPGKKVDALGNAISALQQAHELNPDDRDYIEKISRLQRKKSIAEHFGEKALDRFLVVTPIAVEVAGNLIPCVESETESGLHPTLNRLIGIMRKDINNTSGISIPGIRFRGNEDLPAGTYNIIMNEIPLVSGTILEEKRLFPGPMANLTPLGVFGEETDNPLTGDKAVWIKREDWKKVELSKQALWEVIEYMVRHLEAVIRRNLDEFFGHQEIMTKLSPYDDIYKNMQDTPADLTACTMVMKGLLNEGVPIIEFEKLVERFNESRKDKKNLLTIIDTIRSLPEVKTTLPGNNDQYSFYRLGQRFEEEVKKSVSIEDYLPFLATKPLIIQKALTAVRRKIGSNRNVALFVENAELRPFVRQLIEIEFPLVPVLSRMELLPDLEGKITGEIELE